MSYVGRGGEGVPQEHKKKKKKIRKGPGGRHEAAGSWILWGSKAVGAAMVFGG